MSWDDFPTVGAPSRSAEVQMPTAAPYGAQPSGEWDAFPAVQQPAREAPAAPAEGGGVGRYIAHGASGLVEGVAGIVGLPGTVGRLMDRYVVDPIADRIGLPPRTERQKRPDLLPSGPEVEGALRRVTTIPKTEPATSGERAARDFGQAVGGMILPGTAVPNLVGAGLGWGAGEAARGVGLNERGADLARLGGNLIGAGGAAAAQAVTRSSAPAMLAERMGRYSPEEIQRAAALQAEAQSRGVPMMAQEALDATPGGPMAQLASGAAALSPRGQLPRFANERQPMIAAAAGRAADEIGPAVTDASRVSRELGEAAERVVAEPKNARAALARPYYAAAEGEPLHARVWQGVIDQIDAALVGPRVVPGGALERELMRLRNLSQNSSTVGQADAVLKEFDTIAKARAFASGEPVTEAVRVTLQPILSDMRAGLARQSDNYRRGLSLYDPASPATIAVRSAEGGPAARIAGAQSNPAKEGAATEFARWAHGEQSARRVADEIARLNTQNPEAARDALRLMVQRAGDDAFATGFAGGPSNVGVKLAQGIAPTPQARANVIAAIEAVTGNRTTAVGFDRLLTILERTGVTPGLGSATAGRTAMNAEAGAGGIVGPAIDALNLPRGSFLRTASDSISRARTARTWNDLGHLLTQPDSVERIRRLALMKPTSDKARALAVEIMAADRGSNP
jgi:hypothetical protein